MTRATALVAAIVATGISTAQADVLAPTLLDNETYAEQYVAFADLSDGTYVQVGFGISNVGPGDGRGACRVLVVEPDGGSWVDSKIVEREGWRHVPGSTERLMMGPCEITSGERFTMKAPLDKGHVTLTLAGAPAKLRFDAYAATVGDDFYGVEILVPWARAEVTLQRKGGPERKLTGFGYADHPRSKILPGKLARSWIRFRSLGEKNSRLILVRQPKGGPPDGFYRHQSAAKVPITRAMMKRGGSAKRPAWRVMLAGKNAGPWRIRSGKLLRRYAPVEEHGSLGRLVSAVIGNPVTYTFRAVLEDKRARQRVNGILEITLTDE